MPPGTYIFIVKFEYSIANERGVAVSIAQDGWNMAVWSFDTEKDGHTGIFGGVKIDSYVCAHTIYETFSYEVQAAINWVSEGETNTASALLQAIRLA